ncbi:hypothetical protein VitviT2T_004602 [Vitis vinifera]|uniref:RRM domain-containing protein n=1 Tax=Vitis vinifera TaxID=29760 RepID=A0ABY9BQD8_VITVI|nr:hypothetical protein VitviT2T_004602 [Vitis vinifera]|eukprot:XP_010648466.1 PREDICTED: uncharacterized protein LOC100854295 isoform X2 [Vitis vinifera]
MGNPKSFKIPINSPLATTLKSSISHKLLEFLGNYTDDVLAEYITVLVCNGKHRNQARDDLEAFLGERSEEFVSWLWDLLLDYANQSNTSIVPLDPKGVTFSSPHDNDADMEYRAKRSRNFHNHGTSNDDGSPVISTEGFAAPSNDINTEKVSLLMSGNGMRSELEPVEDIYDDFLAHGCSGKDSFSVMPASGEERILYMDKYQKIVDSKAIDLPKKLFSPSKQPYPRRLQSSIADNPLPRQTSSANAYGRSLSPKVVTAVSHQYDKSRGSVWDRLGKPQKNTFERSKTVDAPGISIREQNGVFLDQSVPVLPSPTERHSKQEAPGLGNGAYNSGKCKKLESGVSNTGKLNGASNISRKRHFGESSTGPGNSSVSLVDKGNMDVQYKETSGDSKKTKLAEEVSEATFAQKMLDLKVRFHQLEREMCKLRSKHTDLKRGGKPDLSSSSGTLRHPEEDIEPRTVYVTNVHFAATKEALSNHFAKCGLVVNVVILTDETIAQPKRSAFITFASVESVNKALALSGTSFFSRTVKVFRKADMATGKSAPPQDAGMPVQARFTHIKGKIAVDRPLYSTPHLQWRRESIPTPSEPSASANIQEKSPSESSASANIQKKSTAGSGSQQPFPS